MILQNLFQPIVSVLSQCFYWLKINYEGVLNFYEYCCVFTSFLWPRVIYNIMQIERYAKFQEISRENVTGFSIRIDLNPLWQCLSQCFWGLKINSEVEFLVSWILLRFHEIYFMIDSYHS